jgi:hypothetical protein
MLKPVSRLGNTAVGIPPETRSALAPGSGTQVLGIEVTKQRSGEYGGSHGPLRRHLAAAMARD